MKLKDILPLVKSPCELRVIDAPPPSSKERRSVGFVVNADDGAGLTKGLNKSVFLDGSYLLHEPVAAITPGLGVIVITLNLLKERAR